MATNDLFAATEDELIVARDLCRQSLAHLEDCSDVWTPGNRLVRALREFLGLPVEPLGAIAQAEADDAGTW